MKRKIALIALCLALTSSNGFAAALDDSYVDMVFDKFESYSDEVKEKQINKAKDLLANPADTEGKGAEILYIQVLNDKKDEMDKHGITETDLRKNVDALKKWSVEDREALIDAGANGDKAAVDALNKKYAGTGNTGTSDNGSSNGGSSSSGGSSGGGGGGGGSSTKSTATTTETVKTPTEKSKEVKEVRMVSLKEKGLLTKERVVKEMLKGKSFSDMSTHWAKEDVSFLAQRGIINGKADGTYDPQSSVTRAEALTLILNMVVEEKGKIELAASLPADVAADKWYADNVKYAEALKLVSRSMDNQLSPEEALTRGEVIEILVNTVDAMEISLEESMMKEPTQFTDFNKLNPSTKEALSIGVNLGFINGTGEGTIAADQLVTRGQMAAFMKRLYTYVMTTI